MHKKLLLASLAILAGINTLVAGTAIKQPTVPKNFKPMPFIEKNPVPQLTPTEQKYGFMLFQRPLIDPVYLNSRPLPYERLNRLSAFAAKGEFKTVSFSIYPTRALKNFKVTVSKLTSATGIIAKSNIDIRLVTYWNIRYPRYSSKSTYRRMPELLEKVTTHSSPAYEPQRWWLTIKVPKTAKPGIYNGTVILQDNSIATPIKLPLKLRVLDFKLLDDPNKHYSAYYTPHNQLQFAGKDEQQTQTMLNNEYQAMHDLGLNMIPTLYIGWNKKTQKLYMVHPEDIKLMQQYGLKGPIPVTAQSIVSTLYRQMVPKGKIGSHWHISKMPPPEFYQKITAAVKTFIKENKAKGWPKLYCKPIDEVAAQSKQFGVKVFKAFHDAGMKTFTTKNPTASDAALYAPYIDAWCSQPYAVPYEKIINQQRFQYWCYPNHNGTEVRDPVVMCKGGRMTFGYGFWRSGFTVLMPWNWSWGGHWNPKLARQFDYLRSANAGSGQRFDKDGNIIFATNWICFREGINDSRYIYTLEQSIWERQNSTNPQCRKTVTMATAYLQKLWDDISVQKKYLRTGMWPSAEFNARRWQLARYITKLQQYPATRKGQAPSVIINTTRKKLKSSTSILQQELKRGNIEVRELTDSFKNWKSPDLESKITLPKTAGYKGATGMRWTVNVDHRHGEKNYPIGWPKIRCTYKPPLDLTQYDYLKYMIRIDSNRNEVDDDTTPFGFTIESNKFFEVVKDLGGNQRTWIPVIFDIRQEIQQLGRGDSPWQKIKMLQLFIAESNYKDNTKLIFDIGAAQLLRFKYPLITAIQVPEFVILPKSELSVNFTLMGNIAQNKGYKITAKLIDNNQHIVAATTENISKKRTIIVNTAKLLPGKYNLLLNILCNGKSRSQLNKKISLIPGPFFTMKAATSTMSTTANTPKVNKVGI